MGYMTRLCSDFNLFFFRFAKYFASEPAVLAIPITDTNVTNNSIFPSLNELFDGIFYAAVPKSRRSREKRAKRRFGCHKVREYMTPKTNIVICLNCGHYHEAHTLCGHCYEKVKMQTQQDK